jgi:NADPH:quinone reductase-like Zn-dependent oxidoreductase
MRAWEIRGTFGLGSLTLVEREERAPGPGEVAVRVRAASLNYRDLLTLEGSYDPKQALPLVPLSDGAGEVEAVGPGVSRVRPGDHVAGVFAQTWLAGDPTPELRRAMLGGPLDGMLAERVVLDAEGVVEIPGHLSYEEAACLPCAAVTAWSALVEKGTLAAGQTLLVLGTGGVSLFALQLGRLLGARVVVTSSSDDRLERARALGAADGVNYRTTPDWGRVVHERTGGADLVVEVGGAGTLAQSLRAVRYGGTIALVGNLAGLDAEIRLGLVFMRAVRLQGIFVGSRATFEAMNRAIALHGLQPVIDRVFPFAEAPAAFAHMKRQGHFGKIVVRLD